MTTTGTTPDRRAPPIVWSNAADVGRHSATRSPGAYPRARSAAGDAGLRGVGLRTGDHLRHGDSGQCITEPPLTVSVAPLTKLAWRLARNTTAAATSSGWPIRRIGHAWIAASTNSGGLSTCCIGVSI